MYPREILTEHSGVVDDCARWRGAEKFLIKASKRRTFPNHSNHPYPILFYVCSYIQFPFWHVHLIFSKSYKANALQRSREWWVCLWKCVNGKPIVNLELLALLLRVLVIRYSDGQAPLLAIFWTEPRSGGPSLSTWLVGSDTTLLAAHVEAEAILSLVDDDNVRLEDPPPPSLLLHLAPIKNSDVVKTFILNNLLAKELVSTILWEGWGGTTPWPLSD